MHCQKISARKSENSYNVLIRKLVLLCCLLLAISGCSQVPSNTSAPTITRTATATQVQSTVVGKSLTDADLVAAMVRKMSLAQKLGQMVIVEFYGATLNNDLQQMIANNAIGGVLIENKNGNAQSRNQLVALNKAMQARARIPLFISTDFEGGVVNELRRITGERPSEATIGATRDPQVAYDAGQHAATDLTALGLNLNFMPIVDVLTNPNNPGLPQRTFGSDAALVTSMGRAYLKGLNTGGVVGCLKHFPGLGSANLDPHLALPTMDRSLATLKKVDIVP